MSAIRPWMLGLFCVTGLFVAFANAAAPTSQPSFPEMSHVVPFKIGSVTADDEDNITITQVLGTSEQFTVGGVYTVKGTYHLASKDEAMMAAYVTASKAESTHSKIGPSYRLEQYVGRGDGDFTLVFTMTCKGSPHISVYPTDGGSSIASVYFGTGDSLQKN